ncbi:hypothetical protein RT41_GL000656 [Lactococcus fujiensis JCM 16395]|uniref:Uncharacterized protein n=2 Tax=Lactococcus fujiensis TaxID=610251 RepID=A0A2A5RIH0_9LACT|nr:hypothetical protein RT41_GL000656 [Lactococcus fujiensis JCM 16395]
MDKKITSIKNALKYKAKGGNLSIDNLIASDKQLAELIFHKEQIEVWYCAYPEAKQICELRWIENKQQWEIEQEVLLSKATIYRRYSEFKATLTEWTGIR